MNFIYYIYMTIKTMMFTASLFTLNPNKENMDEALFGFFYLKEQYQLKTYTSLLSISFILFSSSAIFLNNTGKLFLEISKSIST